MRNMMSILVAMAVVMLLESAELSVAVGQEGNGRTDQTATDSADREPQRARIEALIEQMGRSGRDNQKVREEARAELQNIGEIAVPYITAALHDEQWNRRLSAVILLRKMKPRESTQALIEVLYRGTPKGREAPWWMEMFLRRCGQSFRAITGQQFWYNPEHPNAWKAVEKMLDWWNRNWQDYPEQVGTLAASRPEPAEGGADRGEAGASEADFDPAAEIRKLEPLRYPKPSVSTAAN